MTPKWPKSSHCELEHPEGKNGNRVGLKWKRVILHVSRYQGAAEKHNSTPFSLIQERILCFWTFWTYRWALVTHSCGTQQIRDLADSEV